MSKQKKLVGFYRELPNGLPNGPSIHAVIGTAPHTDEEKIVAYLRGGTIVVVTMGPGRDFLSPTLKRIDPPHLVTDGLWLWHLDLAYYVEAYHAMLPEEFVARMRSFNWVPPSVDAATFDLPSPEECDIL